MCLDVIVALPSCPPDVLQALRVPPLPLPVLLHLTRQLDPTSGAIVATTDLLSGTNDPTARLTLGSTFDAEGGVFYSNVISVLVRGVSCVQGGGAAL